MSRLTVRQMLRPDLPQAQALFDPLGMLQNGQLRRVFTQIGGSKGAIHLVAQTDGEIVGALLAQFNGVHVFLSHIAVAERVRGQGIGRRLHAALERRAKKLGAQGIITDSRMSAVGFYERLDYRIPGAVFLIRRFTKD